MALKNDRLLKALRREATDVTPVWLMRQAGRYLPEYRAVREKAGDFMTLCKTPELACEVTLQPLRRFPLDAAIIFSDILTIPDAMGLGLEFTAGEGPRFAKPIRTENDIAKLSIPKANTDLSYVMQAISLTKQALADSVPLLGFSGSPWTLATYMVEGSASKNFSLIKQMMFNAPEMLHQLLEILTAAVIDYLIGQIAAGADAIMIFDTWGGILSSRAYQDFSLLYMAKIVAVLKADRTTATTPIILFTKGGGQWLEIIAQTGCDAISLDWTVDLAQARHRLKGAVALQGNLDPATLYAKPEVIRAEVVRILKEYGPYPGHIFNLGHGITPDVSPEQVTVLIEAVHAESQHIMETKKY